MIIILKKGAPKTEVDELCRGIEAQNIIINEVRGEHTTILGLIGDTHKIDMEAIQAQEIVESVQRVQEPYKGVNRKFHPEDTVISVGNTKIGDGNVAVIAGPCSIETEEQIVDTCMKVKEAGANLLRGGAFKPRTSPYSFQGLGGEGLTLFLKAKKATGLPIVTELMSLAHLDLFADVDVIQVGARNMQNFEMLKELGKCNKPILLKRGLSSTIEELLMSAEYIFAGGNTNVILCERGIRTFETQTRNTLDISAVPVIKSLSHLPVVIDPSHATGKYELVEPMSMAAVAAGADGLIIEVHNNPQKALCDGAQSLTPKHFSDCVKKCSSIASVMGKTVGTQQ